MVLIYICVYLLIGISLFFPLKKILKTFSKREPLIDISHKDYIDPLTALVVLGIWPLVLIFFLIYSLYPNAVLDPTNRKEESTKEENAIRQPKIDDKGIANSTLRPVGIARFGEIKVTVNAESGFIEKGEQIRITKIKDGMYYVDKD